MPLRPLSLVLALMLLAAAGPAHAAAETAAPASIVLPAAQTDGKVAIEKALATRRSVRTIASTPLMLGQVGQLCWAAQGITDEKGHRTAPSARAVYPLELYVIAGAVEGLPAGVYHYVPAGHTLQAMAAGDQRAEFVTKAVGQTWSQQAPAIFVLTGKVEKMGRMRERGVSFMWVEAGLAAQGFFLQATALGLGSTYVGGFDPAAARSALGLAAAEDVLAVLPVGHKQ
jgi:SagB-type dehydrogenase family enzyme